jgi:hypothetical protein
VKIKGGTADRSAIQHFLHRHIINRLLLDQLYQSTAKPLVSAPDALIELSPLLFLFHLPSMILQSGEFIPGHWLPICSATRKRT